MKRLLAAYRLWKTRRELYALSDHMLRDIGLRRDQLSSDFLLAKTNAAVSRGAANFNVLVRVPYCHRHAIDP